MRHKANLIASSDGECNLWSTDKPSREYWNTVVTPNKIAGTVCRLEQRLIWASCTNPHRSQWELLWTQFNKTFEHMLNSRSVVRVTAGYKWKKVHTGQYYRFHSFCWSPEHCLKLLVKSAPKYIFFWFEMLLSICFKVFHLAELDFEKKMCTIELKWWW